MSRRERNPEGFWPKVMVATIVVIWVSLVAGNWLGNFLINKLAEHEKGEGVTEFKEDLMRGARPRPWQKADPKLQQELDKQRTRLTGEKPRPVPQEIITASPVPPDAKATATSTPVPTSRESEAPAPDATPADVSVAPAETPTPAETPAEPTPTPAATPESTGPVELQFGSFSSEENAKALIEDLAGQGQDARIEAIPTDNGTVYRVRGGGFNGTDDARTKADKLREQGIDAYIVNP